MDDNNKLQHDIVYTPPRHNNKNNSNNNNNNKNSSSMKKKNPKEEEEEENEIVFVPENEPEEEEEDIIDSDEDVMTEHVMNHRRKKLQLPETVKPDFDLGGVPSDTDIETYKYAKPNKVPTEAAAAKEPPAGKHKVPPPPPRSSSRDFRKKSSIRLSIINKKDSDDDGGKNNNNNSNNKEALQLEPDIYSMMYISTLGSSTFLCTLLVSLLQLLILSLVIADMQREEDDGFSGYSSNQRLPVDVLMPVVIAQFASLAIILLQQRHMITSLDALISVGHDESVTWQFPGATATKWVFSHLLRHIVGLAHLLASFYIVVHANRVLTLFINFAALQFIADLDHSAYWLAERGYLGLVMQTDAVTVKTIQLSPNSSSPTLLKKMKEQKWITWWFMTMILSAMMLAGLILIRVRQANGYYLKEQSALRLTVQFGEEVYPLSGDIELDLIGATRTFQYLNSSNPPDLYYAFFSGTYQAWVDGDHRLHQHDDRPIYYERDPATCRNDPTCGMFYYCGQIHAWVFTIRALNNALKERNECKYGWLAQSAETNVYKLEDAPQTGWQIWTGVMTETQSLLISNHNECRRNADCSFNGKCQDGKCICNAEWQGKKCHLKKQPCPALWWIHYGKSSSEYYQYGPYFLVTEGNNENDDSTPVTFHDRPIYSLHYKDARACPRGLDTYHIYLYTGRRWVSIQWCLKTNPDGPHPLSAKGELPAQSLHPYWDNFLESGTVEYFSEVTESETGIGINMFQKRVSQSKGMYAPWGAHFPVQATFECIDVACQNDTAVCGLFGECQDKTFRDGTYKLGHHACFCSDNFGGEFCQFSPNEEYTSEQYTRLVLNQSVPGAFPNDEYYWLYWNQGFVHANYMALPSSSDPLAVPFSDQPASPSDHPEL